MPEPISQSNAPGGETAHCDVLVIGGGPGGSTAASVLAEKGYRVTSV
jgi:choline dehydrogenase-like flavoprotein